MHQTAPRKQSDLGLYCVHQTAPRKQSDLGLYCVQHRLLKYTAYDI